MVKNRRRLINYSVKRRMQIRLLVTVMLVVVVAVGFSSVFFYIFSNQEVGATYRQFHINVKNFLELLLPGVIIAFALGIVSAAAVAIFFPHRIAGPLHRIERDLTEGVGEGNLKVIFSVRKGDEVGELANALNITVEKLKSKISRIKASQEEFASVLRKTEGNHRAIDALKKLEDAVKEFKL